MGTEPKMQHVGAREWDDHWDSLHRERPIFSLIARATRRWVFQPAVAHYADLAFADSGTFIEAGCGTGYSSARMPRRQRTLVGLDFSAIALREARTSAGMQALMQADLFAMPCRSESIDGIWNLGVMEHFSEEQISASLREFHRVLKPGGVILLFWPSASNSSRWLLAPVEKLLSSLRRSDFTFFPGEISRLPSKRHARTLIESQGFEIDLIDFNWRTAFIHMVIAARKR